MKVQAIRSGYYDLKRKKAGDIFTLKKASEFSEKWMKVPGTSSPHEEDAVEEKPKAKGRTRSKDAEVI